MTWHDVTGSRELVWATSWGVSTRLIGAMVMSHSDDKGMYMPLDVCVRVYECMYYAYVYANISAYMFVSIEVLNVREILFMHFIPSLFLLYISSFPSIFISFFSGYFPWLSFNHIFSPCLHTFLSPDSMKRSSSSPSSGSHTSSHCSNYQR